MTLINPINSDFSSPYEGFSPYADSTFDPYQFGTNETIKIIESTVDSYTISNFVSKNETLSQGSIENLISLNSLSASQPSLIHLITNKDSENIQAASKGVYDIFFKSYSYFFPEASLGEDESFDIEA